MITEKKGCLAFAVCGSFCTLEDALGAAQALTAQGWTLLPVMSFAAQQDKVLAEVRAYHEARHGSERWANRAAFSEATDLFRFRAIPGVEVSTKLFLLCEGCRYDITSVEDVKGRGMYVEILAKKVVAANG